MHNCIPRKEKKEKRRLHHLGIDKKEKLEVKDIYLILSFPVGLYTKRKSMSNM